MLQLHSEASDFFELSLRRPELLRRPERDLFGLFVLFELRREDRRDLDLDFDLDFDFDFDLDFDLDFERLAFGVRLLRAALRRDDLRLELRDDLFGDLGVRARRLDTLRLELFFLGVFGVRLLRAALRRDERRRLALRDFLGAFGVRARRLDDLRLELLLFEAFGVRLRETERFCFFAEGFDPERARFLIPISLLRFSSMVFLYSSRSVAQV